MGRRRRWVLGLLLVAGLAGAASAVRFGPAIGLSLALAAPRVEDWFARLTPEPGREEIVLDAGGRRLAADRYQPPRARGGLLLVHGLSRAGRRHPELERLARLLARRGQLVLVPHFEGLAEFRLSGAEVAEVAAALGSLRRMTARAGIAGFSFGAGPALLAAADSPGLRLVGAFGGYADLRNVIAFLTTGSHAWAGVRHAARQEEYNRWKALSLLAGTVEDDRDRRLLAALGARKLANPHDDTGVLERDLGPPGRAVWTLVTNRQEETVGALIDALPPATRQALDALSPLRAVRRLTSPLLVAHGIGDDSIPYTESLRLAAATGGPARLVLLHTFHHTGSRSAWPSLTAHAGDAWGLARLADDLLRP
jgi:alpha/beta superfamily hydrolase